MKVQLKPEGMGTDISIEGSAAWLGIIKFKSFYYFLPEYLRPNAVYQAALKNVNIE